MGRTIIISDTERQNIKSLYEQEINLETDCKYFTLVDESELINKKNTIIKLIHGLEKDNISTPSQFRLWGMAIIDHTQDLFGTIMEKNLTTDYKQEMFDEIIKHFKNQKEMYDYYLDYRAFSCIKDLLNKLYNIRL